MWRTNDAKTPNTPTQGPKWASIKPSTGNEISAPEFITLHRSAVGNGEVEAEREALVIAGLAWDVHYERTVWSQRAAYLHASLGKDKEDAGDLAGALPEYGAAVKLYPGNAKAWYG